MEQSREVSSARSFCSHHSERGPNFEGQANNLFEKLKTDHKTFKKRVDAHIIELWRENENLKKEVRALKRGLEREKKRSSRERERLKASLAQCQEDINRISDDFWNHKHYITEKGCSLPKVRGCYKSDERDSVHLSRNSENSRRDSENSRKDSVNSNRDSVNSNRDSVSS